MFHMHLKVAGTWLLKHTPPWVQIECANFWVVVLVVLPKRLGLEGALLEPVVLYLYTGMEQGKNDSICPQ